ncbi:MAG: EamA/RhaT family transporter [Paracoccaceae bacterium]|nr:MAG: EamA/RhaT family transporter [Paracoccaceae bacterium]
MVWVLATLIAAMLQTARNATQAGLTATLGTLGATQVRFLYGLPFAVLALGVIALGHPLPRPGQAALAWAMLGGMAQIGATALMLAAMRLRGFAQATGWIKTEPALVALAGAGLGQTLSPLAWAGVAVASLGAALPARAGSAPAMAAAIGAAALFGLAAIGFREAVLALPSGAFFVRASVVLVLALAFQSVALGLWLAVFRPAALGGSLRVWRGSLAAGALGAGASFAWFSAFALATAAEVRTLALVEVALAAIWGRAAMGQHLTARMVAGLVLIGAGVGMLLSAGGGG